MEFTVAYLRAIIEQNLAVCVIVQFAVSPMMEHRFVRTIALTA